MTQWGPIVVVAVLGAGVCVMGAALHLWQRHARRSDRRNPLSTSLLRSPGETLRDRIDGLGFDIAAYLAFGMMAMPITAGLYLAHWVSAGKAPGLAVTATFLFVGAAVQVFLVRGFWRAFAEVRQLRLGYEAEVAVGQALNELGRHGYRIFHDFPAERFNVDHIVVGPAGVYAIETKGRSKPHDRRSNKTEYTLSYDGGSLQFPDHTEQEPLAQAARNADYLRKFLTSAVGERVEVQPVVVVPGWFIKSTNRDAAIAVLPLGGIHTFFANRPPAALSDKLIRQIAHQLEQRCRNVAPRAYAAGKDDPKFAASTSS